MDQQQDWSFGENHAWFEPPEILRARFRGVLDEASARWSVGLYQELGLRQRFYLLADITGSRHTPEGRKLLAENLRSEWFFGIVYIGASPEQQAVSTGFMLAARKGGLPPYEFVFVDTLEEARAWVEAHQSRRLRAL